MNRDGDTRIDAVTSPRRRPREMNSPGRGQNDRHLGGGVEFRSCPRICIGGVGRNRPVVTAEEIGVVRRGGDGDGVGAVECPVIRLSLRKPRNWNWKLTTTSSSPSLIAPVIRLVDDNGNVLFDESATSQADHQWREDGGGALVNQQWRGGGGCGGGNTRANVNRCFTSGSESCQSIRATSPRQKHERGSENDGNEHRQRPPPDSGRAEMVSIVGGNVELSDRGSRNDSSSHCRRVSDVWSDTPGDLLQGAASAPVETTASSCSSAVGGVCRGNSDKTDGNGNSLAKERKTRHRHRGKLDSGYKSFAVTTAEAGVMHDARKGKCVRRKAARVHAGAASASASSTSEDEEEEETTKKKKRRYRKAAVIGDCLVSINGNDASLYDRAVDLLRDAPDVVHLRLSHRRRLSDVTDQHNHQRRDGDSSTGGMSSRRSRRRRQQQRHDPLSGMGANVSRHSEKGLSGRRTQSSGNLCNGNKQLARDVGRILTSCSNVSPKDRNKFCGSLPNHLDGDYGDNDLDEDECCNNNNGRVCAGTTMNGNLSAAGTAAGAAAGAATAATTSTTVRKNQKNGVELRLMPQQHDLTALHDQGYGSERSPEEEHLPPLPEPDPFWNLSKHYPFITPDLSFEVSLVKGNRGLGLSVTGGVDTAEQWPGLIRIKRLFPHQPAWMSGQLCVGDVLLAANGVALTGLSNYQALEVLRTTPNNVALAVCRPPSDVFALSAPGEPPLPPRRDPANSITSSRILVPLPLLVTDEPYGEFDIILTKVNRSLGFTLRKEDESVLGHYVRALVREPALSDGRIRPGDKIVSVNDMPMSPLSHEEAVAFLRQCGDSVKLRLYRDAAQTPVAALSPTEESSVNKPKPMLRQEAQDMLTDLAVRKLSPGNSSGSSHGFLRLSEGPSPTASPRRRRLTKTPSPDMQTVAQDRLGQRYLLPSPCGDSDYTREPSRNNTFLLTAANGQDIMFDHVDDADVDKPQRPKFLDLCVESDALSPGTARKQKYMFASNGSRSEDSLALTSATEDLTKIGGLGECCPDNGDHGASSMEPASLPPLSSTSSTSTFSYRNPAYQSAHPACNVPKKAEEEEGAERLSDHGVPGKAFEEGGEGSRGLLKWKGVTFSTDDQAEAGNTSTDTESVTGNEEELIVELNRGWNSRLGFSLQGNGSHTYISAVYSDSVAAKDGRLQANDRLIMVNDENVEDMSTAEIIDLLRKIRGTIGIRVMRKRGPNI